MHVTAAYTCSLYVVKQSVCQLNGHREQGELPGQFCTVLPDVHAVCVWLEFS